KSKYLMVKRLIRAGVWMQITAGSLAGRFGRTAEYWGERMLEEDAVHIIATDAHDVTRRPPDLRRGRDLGAVRVGEQEAQHMVLTRPAGVLRNVAPQSLPTPKGAALDPTLSYTGGSNQTGSGDAAEVPSSSAGPFRGLIRQLRHFFV